MFDCHGTIDLYCWDGGKTWVVEGRARGQGKTLRRGDLRRVGEALLDAMRPGRKISELQARAREVYRQAGVPGSSLAP